MMLLVAILNVLFLLGFAAMYVLGWDREAFGGPYVVNYGYAWAAFAFLAVWLLTNVIALLVFWRRRRRQKA